MLAALKAALQLDAEVAAARQVLPSAGAAAPAAAAARTAARAVGVADPGHAAGRALSPASTSTTPSPRCWACRAGAWSGATRWSCSRRRTAPAAWRSATPSCCGRGAARRRRRCAAASSTPPGSRAGSACAVTNLAERGAPPLWLTVLQDSSAEVAAREQARRAQDELAQWFELSGSGMLVYDASGLIVRCNAAFEALVERVPVVLDEASARAAGAAGVAGRRHGAGAGAGRAADREPGAGGAGRRPPAPPVGAPGVLGLRARRAPRDGRRAGPQRRGRARPGAARDGHADGHRQRRRRHLRPGARLAGAGRRAAAAQSARGDAAPGHARRRRACWASAANSSRPNRCPSSSACSARCAPANAPRCVMPCATPSSARAGC